MYIIEGEKYPVVYIANYRVGSTATGCTLMNMGGQQVNDHHGLPSPDTDLSGFLVVQTVRHHCEVLVSCWYKQGRRWKFEEFVNRVLDGKDPYLGPKSFYNRFPCNYVLRYESLQVDFNVLCVNAGLPETELLLDPSMRPKDDKWTKIFSQSLAEKVYGRYSDEMEKYGYTIENNLNQLIEERPNYAKKKLF